MVLMYFRLKMVMSDAKMARYSHLSVASYNCRGFNTSKQCYIKSLLSRCSVLFLQEHWLSDDQLSLLGSLDDNFLFTGVSGFGKDKVLPGRPFGGCAILWRSDMDIRANVLDTCSNRICAVRLCSDLYSLLIINVYMPYESSEATADDFADQLALIESTIEANADCHVIIGGDFNVDLSRPWVHTTMLTSFCDNAGLSPDISTRNLVLTILIILI